MTNQDEEFKINFLNDINNLTHKYGLKKVAIFADKFSFVEGQQIGFSWLDENQDKPSDLLCFTDPQFSTLKNGSLEWETVNGIYKISHNRTAQWKENPKLSYKANNESCFFVIDFPLEKHLSYNGIITRLKKYANEHVHKLVAQGVYTPKPDVRIVWEYKNNALFGTFAPLRGNGWITIELCGNFPEIYYDEGHKHIVFDPVIIWNVDDFSNRFEGLQEDEVIPMAIQIAQEWANKNM